MHDTLSRLTELLRELPGIGPRQARRLAYWFVRREKTWVDAFAKALVDARREVSSCDLCMRLFPSERGMPMCPICANIHRDTQTVLVVEKDVDLENIEKTGAYRGTYFVLGGTTSPLDKAPERKVRIRELRTLLQKNERAITELIFALSATTEGEDTILYLKEQLTAVCAERNITVSLLGRGLSTGTELEYVDADTMKYALQRRL
jgi:recombination protein RecR